MKKKSAWKGIRGRLALTLLLAVCTVFAVLPGGAVFADETESGYADADPAGEQPDLSAGETPGRRTPENGAAEAAGDGAGTADFVLILDGSDSMSKSDPNQLYLSSAKMFVDMLPSENARLAVVSFGPDYGDEAYQKIRFTEKDGAQNRRVKVFYELEGISDQASKRRAKAAIDAAAQATADYTSSTYTPIGYAMQAAEEVLKDGGAGEGRAAVILLSDGRVSGQADGYNSALDYTSIDEAADEAAARDWPVYCLELNDDGQNDTADWRGKIGRHEMRENIPGRTKTEPVELKEPEEAERAFTDIFARFFDATSSMTTKSDTISGGEVTMDFDVEELIAETNLTLTGDIREVERIELAQPDGAAEVYPVAGGDVDDENRKVVFENRYITLKLMMPPAGNWKVTVYGTDGVKIGLYAVSIREMTLLLTDSLSGEETAGGSAEGGVPEMDAGSTVTFRASFAYRDKAYTSSAIYGTIPAELVIEKDGEEAARVPMTASGDCYAVTCRLNQPGEYRVYASAEYEGFHMGGRQSDVLRYTVLALPEPTPEPTPEPEPEPEVAEDHPLEFTALAGVSPEAESAEVTENIHLKKIGPPDFLLDFANVSTDSTFTLRYADYFTDADDPSLAGVTFRVEAADGGSSGIRIEEEAADHVTFALTGKGSGSFIVTAEERAEGDAQSDAGTDEIVKKTLLLEIETDYAWMQILSRYWAYAAGIGAALIFIIVIAVLMMKNRY